jgi:hypothetical protein
MVNLLARFRKQAAKGDGVVVTHLIGGLGNQFFQYAVGRSLALRYGVTLKLDIGGFMNYPLRPFELDKYPIEALIATEDDLIPFGIHLKNGVCEPTAPQPNYTHYHERHFRFDRAVKRVAPPVYLSGHWQSERYFKHIASTIRRELTPKEAMDAANQKALDSILRSTSVAVHIRRGDYVANPITAAYHGVPTISYYRRAMDYIAMRTADPVFYLFSDDPEWTHENIRHNAPVVQIAINKPDRGYRDVQLMSACKHYVIANSSFGWWGAWMNSSPKKTVIAPTPWFLKSEIDTRDLLPADWITLPAHDDFDPQR